MKTYGAKEARPNFRAILDDAMTGTSTLITRSGRPVAVVLPAPDGKPNDIESRRLGWREGYKACVEQVLKGAMLKGYLRQHVADNLTNRMDRAAAASEAYGEDLRGLDDEHHVVGPLSFGGLTAQEKSDRGAGR